MGPSPHIYTMNGLYKVVKKLFEPYEIVNDALAIVLGAGILGTLFLVANRFLGAFSYSSLTSDQIAAVIKNLTDHITMDLIFFAGMLMLHNIMQSTLILQWSHYRQ